MKARPTQFRGTIYRSKLEAQFAAYMHKAGLLQYRAEYEPQWLAQPVDYVPDFAVSWDIGGKLVIDIVEVKPGMPTDAYKIEFARRMRDWREVVPMTCRALLVWGRITDTFPQHGEQGVLFVNSDGVVTERNKWFPSGALPDTEDLTSPWIGGQHFDYKLGGLIEDFRFDLAKAELQGAGK
jgi:hypothetical protein